jgi:hypothetical protein
VSQRGRSADLDLAVDRRRPSSCCIRLPILNTPTIVGGTIHAVDELLNGHSSEPWLLLWCAIECILRQIDAIHAS